MEIFEDPKENRYSIFPIKHEKIYNLYLNLRSLFWTENEIKAELENDVYTDLPEEVQEVLSFILFWFYVGDGVIAGRLSMISQDIQMIELTFLFNYIEVSENVHNICYSMLVQKYFTTTLSQQEIFQKIMEDPAIVRKLAWIENISKKCKTFAEKMLLNLIIESIFFMDGFVMIYWINTYFKGLRMKGLFKTNEFISREESMHVAIAIIIINMCKNKVEEEEIHRLFREAIELESDVLRFMLRQKQQIFNLSHSQLVDYLRYLADDILEKLGCSKLYNVDQPFPFMDKLSLPRLSDFFEEKSVSEYQLADTKVDYDKLLKDFV